MTDLPTVLVLPIMYFAVEPRAAIDFEATCVFISAGFKATNMHRENADRSCSNAAQQLQLCRTRECWWSRFQDTAQSNIRNGNATFPAYRAGHQVLPPMTFAQHVLSKTIRRIRLTEEKQSLKVDGAVALSLAAVKSEQRGRLMPRSSGTSSRLIISLTPRAFFIPLRWLLHKSVQHVGIS